MQYSKKEERFLDSVDIDYVPLSELARIALEYTKIEPTTDQEYFKVMDFLRYLIGKYKLQCLEGPNMERVNLSTEELIGWLKGMWDAGKYREIDYGVWFDLE